MNSFLNAKLKEICREGEQLMTYRRGLKLSTADIRTAVRMLLTGELLQNALAEGDEAVERLSRDS
jgi:hypothetical protein